MALRKINILKKFGAAITCLSPELIQGLKQQKIEKKIRHIKGRYSPKIPLKEYKLVIAATDNHGVNQKIAERAQKEKVLANIVDGGARSDVIMPAILKKRGLLVAVSTDGCSPSRAKRIRDFLKNVI